MGISVQHNDDGSITVSCGGDSLKFFPNATASAASGTGDSDPGPSITIPDLDDGGDPIITYPLPGAYGTRVMVDKPSGRDIVRVLLDPFSGELRWPGNSKSSLRTHAARLPDAQAVPLCIGVARGQRYDIGPLSSQLRRLRAEIDHRIVPYMAPGDDEPMV